VIALPLLLQLATVGDTLWVTRTVAVPPGREVRAPDWQPEGDVEVLGRPRVVRHGDSAEIAWPVTVWSPGEHLVQVPGPALLAPDGSIDSIAAEPRTLVAASVLPTRPDSGLRPQPAVPALPLRERSLLPLAILLGLAGALLAPLHFLWRRRGRPMPVPDAAAVAAPAPPVERWAEWGEWRAVIGAAVERLRGAVAARVPEAPAGLEAAELVARLAERRPDWPVSELDELLRTLEARRFAPEEPADASALYRRVEALEARLPA